MNTDEADRANEWARAARERMAAASAAMPAARADADRTRAPITAAHADGRIGSHELWAAHVGPANRVMDLCDEHGWAWDQMLIAETLALDLEDGRADAWSRAAHSLATPRRAA